jgi:hypothetical protein
MNEKSLVERYFSLLDGKNMWEEVRPVAEELVVPDYILEMEHDAIQRQEWLESVEKFVKGGGSIEILKLEEVPGGVQWEVIVHNTCGTITLMASVGHFREGKLFRVEPMPVDLSAYDKLKADNSKYKGKVIHKASSFSQRE